MRFKMDNIENKEISNEELLKNYKTILEFISFLENELNNIKKEVCDKD